MTAEASGHTGSVPELAPDATPDAIRDALIDEERDEFERRFRAAMANAAETLDLTGVLDLLRTYHRIAVQTRHHGAEVQRRMLDKARSITAGRHNPDAVLLETHRARLDDLLNR